MSILQFAYPCFRGGIRRHIGFKIQGFLNCEGSSPSESTSKLKLNSSVHSIDPNSNFIIRREELMGLVF